MRELLLIWNVDLKIREFKLHEWFETQTCITNDFDSRPTGNELCSGRILSFFPNFIAVTLTMQDLAMM